MPKFVIEREIPGAGDMTSDQLQVAAQNSLSVLRDLGPQIQWLHSYVTDNKVYCIYWAPNSEIIQEHAKRYGIPANRISAVRRLMNPATSEARDAGLTSTA
jgi:hypothetical protein